MAEFIDVVHTIQRICKRANGKCPACLLGKFACPNNVRFDKTDEAAFRELEDVVNKWAAENPEPVYPTWIEWFREIGVVSSEQKGFHIWLHNHIPADIAQKLGIEPKEG